MSKRVKTSWNSAIWSSLKADFPDILNKVYLWIKSVMKKVQKVIIIVMKIDPPYYSQDIYATAEVKVGR